MFKVLVSNIGFGQASPKALLLLKEKVAISLNENSVRYDEPLLSILIQDADILIAGTEKISREVLKQAQRLKLIARVGGGVDSIDLEAVKEKQISISYTPEAPAEAIPEFTLTLMLNLIKNIGQIDRKMHDGDWQRYMGKMLSSMIIGIVGAGRIGARLIRILKILYPDIQIYFYDPFVDFASGATKVELNALFEISDLVSLHLPLTDHTRNLVGPSLLQRMKPGSYLINTARGGIVDEEALYEFLSSKHIAAAALDVFNHEPYQGPLNRLENCLLTSHIGSMTQEVREIMENQVSEDILRFVQNKPLLRALPGFNFREN
jgi:D-3-phosphoglycerate dehydrogenase